MSTPASTDRSSEDGVVFRDMTLEDVPTVNALEQRLFPADAWPLQMFLAELSQPETRRYVVAESGGDIVGYAGLMCIEPIADVQTIAVVPEFEGRGIGSALLTRLIDEARRRRAADVLLEVREDNPRAQQLYVRFGFEQIHVRRKYYRDGVDALIMRLQLVPDGAVPGGVPAAEPTTEADPTTEVGHP
ncbi:ribosomal-protein-alanine N-acetyltransferase [Pseudarthrobacter sulfonivorans]|nr:ribosomal-protein-alanine N-acetyltransferase [Pseudarthrobacter sulfonivorans]